MNVQLLTRKLMRTLRDDGVAAACRRVVAHLGQRPVVADFDRRHGTDTGGLEPLWKLSIGSPNARYGERYEATDEHELVAALEFLGEDLRGFTFIDLGCGKGRTLLVAARMGFAQVIGVEFARELAEIATGNLHRLQAANASVLHADAADFVFPHGNLVLYLYNPFSEQVLQQVMSRLRAADAGRRYVIYKRPRCAAVLDTSDFLERHGHPPTAAQMEIWRGCA
jgi:SAM-dependent methyltransferase